MGNENVFQENQEYLIKARNLVDSMDDMQVELEQTKSQRKKLVRNISQEEKSMADEINSTVKSRRGEIEDTYNKELSANAAKNKQLQAKKDKKKNERMGNRIESETAELNDSNRRLALEAKEYFKQNHVSAFCNSGFYYCMFMPRGVREVFITILLSACFCLGIPAACCGILALTAFKGQDKVLAYAIICFVIILAEFIIYFLVFKTTRLKHDDVIQHGRKLRDKVNQNNRQISRIKKNITKDKDESVYNLDKYDDKLAELKRERESITNQKLEAVNAFENDTKKVLTEEITSRRQPKIDELKGQQTDIDDKIASLEEQLSQMQKELTNDYISFLGKDMCTEEKLNDLIAIMEEGSASTVSGAIELYKSTR
jgi:hypothetical protein